MPAHKTALNLQPSQLDFRFSEMIVEINMYTGLLFTVASIASVAAGEKGIDVSHYQKGIDWAKVKAAGIQFAVAKATEGASYKDPTFALNVKGMKANDIKAAAYHYLRGADSAAVQVANIKAALQKSVFDASNDVLAIDVEVGGNTGVSADKMADTLNSVLTELKKTYSKLYIYCGPSYWEDSVSWKKYDFSVYPLWIAHYTQKPAPTIPSTWRLKSKGYTWWQYTDKGKVNGINGNVDLDKSM